MSIKCGGATGIREEKFLIWIQSPLKSYRLFLVPAKSFTKFIHNLLSNPADIQTDETTERITPTKYQLLFCGGKNTKDYVRCYKCLALTMKWYHRRWKTEARINHVDDVIIGPVPVRMFSIGHHFPCHDSVTPHIRRWRKPAIGNSFWSSPANWDSTSLQHV